MYNKYYELAKQRKQISGVAEDAIRTAGAERCASSNAYVYIYVYICMCLQKERLFGARFYRKKTWHNFFSFLSESFAFPSRAFLSFLRG